MILLDTDICVAFLNGNSSVAARLAATREPIAVPAVVAGELFYGAKASKHGDRNTRKLRQFFDMVAVVPFGSRTAEVLGDIKAHLRHIGKPTGEVDAMIAATAIEQGATLVTHNTRHYRNVPDLHIADWLEPDPQAP